MPKTSYKHYRRRTGDRSDGRLLRSLSGFELFIPYVMAQRNDALNFFSENVEITEADRWLRKQRVNGYKGMGFLHVLIAAYIRAVAKYPAMNRFISGRHYYARNDIEVVMTVKKTMELGAPETTIKLHFNPSDTIYDVYHKMNDSLSEVKGHSDDSDTEAFANALKKLPRPIFRLVIGILKILDYFGWLKKEWMEVSPFHGSMVITDLGSLGIRPVFHHIYNFGNVPVFLAFGAKRKAYEVTRTGTVEQRKYIDFNLTLDERICDGHYMASAVKFFKTAVADPTMLEAPPEEVNEDVF